MGRPGWIAALATLTVAGVATVLVAGAINGEPAGLPAAQAGRTSTSPQTPSADVIIRECWVDLASTTVSLTVDEASRLTTRAARTHSSSDGNRLAALVARELDQPAHVATAIATSLLGRGHHRLTCSFSRDDVEPQTLGPRGLTPRAQRLRRAWTQEFGHLPAGGFARGGVSTGHIDNSAHYEGRAIDVFFRPLGDAEKRREGWVFAQWLVAHAQEYDVLSVIYADRIWTSWGSFLGWRDYIHPSGNSKNPVLRHLDHVHVAVESGKPWRG